MSRPSHRIVQALIGSKVEGPQRTLNVGDRENARAPSGEDDGSADTLEGGALEQLGDVLMLVDEDVGIVGGDRADGGARTPLAGDLRDRVHVDQTHESPLIGHREG
jgi:hypothetical protein